MTSIHEAGHAVYALRRCILFDYVTVLPISNSAVGHIALTEQNIFIDDKISVLWAGMCAEKLYRPKRVSWTYLIIKNREGDIAMIQRAFDGRKRAPINVIDFTLKHYAPQATSLLKKYWLDVVKVAEALDRNKTLTYEGVHRLLGTSRN